MQSLTRWSGIPRPAGLSRRWSFLLVLLAAALAPATAAAHVKYFEDAAPHPLRVDLIFGERTALLLAASLAALAALLVIRRLAGAHRCPATRALPAMAFGAPTLLAVQAGIGLVFAAVQPGLLSPHLSLAAGPVAVGLAAVQLAIAFAFITGVGDWIGALVLLGLVPVAMALFPGFDLLEQSYWVGIALVLLVIGRHEATEDRARPWFRRRDPAWAARALAALRVSTGLAIVAAALGEKLWNPALGGAFLARRPELNFFRSVLGWEWFSDDLFVLVAGVTEGVIGVLLASGVSTRLVILGMWLPFNLGIPFLPPQELLGHLPLLGICYVLLVGPAPASAPHPAARQHAATPAPAPAAPGGAGRYPTRREPAGGGRGAVVGRAAGRAARRHPSVRPPAAGLAGRSRPALPAPLGATR